LFRYRIGAACRLSRRTQGARVVAQLFEDTLHDGFGTREVGHRLLDVCRNNFHVIEPAVVARYRADPRQPVVTLTLVDFAARNGVPVATREEDAVAA